MELYICLFGFVGMHSATAYKWTVTKFSYLSFRICLSDISRRVSNLFLKFTTYLLFISLLIIEDQSKDVILCLSYFCIDSGISLLWQFSVLKILLQKRSMPHSSKHYLSTSCLFLYRFRHIFTVTIQWSEDTPSKEEYASQFKNNKE